MVYSFYDSNSSPGSDISGMLSPNPTTLHNHGATTNGVSRASTSPSLVLESTEKVGMMLKLKCPAAATARVGVNNETEITSHEAKSLAALKSHSEAERRRRERINGHLATLRALVPSSTQKMDKATLLAKVISQVKELKNTALEASKGFLIPTEADEVNVESYYDDIGDGSVLYRASVCCDYKPEILCDLRKTLDALQLQQLRAEISTLGDRMKYVIVFTCCKGDSYNNETCQALASTVHQELSCVLEKACSSLEYSLRTSFPNKRRRLCLVETSTSSCNHECSC